MRVAPQPLNAENGALSYEADSSEEFEDALLDLLRNHESFSEEMFLQALRSQRSVDLVES